ncbi:MAG: non-canonical purine NTP pyrophosphatase, partial [Patescibacteria group bacterium]
RRITLITGNSHKVRDVSSLLGVPIDNLDLEAPEIQSFSLKEIALYKAKEAYRHIKSGLILTEDAGLRFHAFDKLPGPFIKWFYKKLHNEGLVRLLKGFVDRRASAEVCFCLYDGKEPKFFEARTGGEIARIPKGGQGFGWDAIFIPNGSRKTWGQMTTEEKNKNNMRSIAIQELKEHLKKIGYLE